MIAKRTYNAAQLLQAWHGGIPLCDAVKQFEPQLEKAELLRLARENRSLAELGKRNWRAAGVNADDVSDKWAKAQFRLEAVTNARVNQELQLIAALESGELLAIGYDAAKGSAAKPELVPQFLLQQQFAKFTKSEFRDREWRFAKVRVAPDSEIQKSTIGRPNYRKYVFEIADIIRDEIVSLKPGQQAQKIYQYGKKKFPKKFINDNPSSRTIARHLEKYWKYN